MKLDIDAVYAKISDTYRHEMKHAFPMKGLKVRARKIFLAFCARAGYDVDSSPETAVEAFGAYCDARATSFGKWTEASSSNWLGFLDNKEAMLKWAHQQTVQSTKMMGKKEADYSF